MSSSETINIIILSSMLTIENQSNAPVESVSISVGSYFSIICMILAINYFVLDVKHMGKRCQ
jgi:hypothetical protein